MFLQKFNLELSLDSDGDVEIVETLEDETEYFQTSETSTDFFIISLIDDKDEGK